MITTIIVYGKSRAKTLVRSVYHAVAWINIIFCYKNDEEKHTSPEEEDEV